MSVAATVDVAFPFAPVSAPPASHILVKRMLDLIELRYADVITLRTLGETLERQPAHLGSLFRRELGITARECLTRVRLARATELILNGVKIEAVAMIVGYRSKKNFYRQFKRHFATTPEAYRQKTRLGDSGMSATAPVRDRLLRHFADDGPQRLV
jgi:two-component system response regulator YesN